MSAAEPNSGAGAKNDGDSAAQHLGQMEAPRAGQSSSAAFGLFPQLIAVSQKKPDAPAIIDGGTKFSYGDLVARVDAFSDELTAAGVKPLDRVALVCGNCKEFFVAAFAAWNRGAVLVPLNPLLQQNELLRYILDSSPCVAVTQFHESPMISSLQTKGASFRHVWLSEGTQHSEDAAVDEDVRPAEIIPPSPISANWPAIIQYSTGSTGYPKRVTRTHAQLLGESLAFSGTLKMTGDDRVLGVAPFFHSHGLMNSAMLSLLTGSTLYAVDAFFPRDIAKLIERERISGYPGVPFMFQQLAGLPERYDFSSLRFVFSGGVPLPEQTAQAFEATYSIRIRELYGSTETGVICGQVGDPVDDSFGCVGRPFPGISVRIVDEHGHPVPEGTAGRVQITSRYAATRYDNTSGNSESYFADGAFNPGDVGRIAASGELVLSGRHRGFINVGGYKVDPAEVEAVLLELTGVREAIVFGVPDNVVGEKVKAVLVASSDLSSAEVRAHLMPRLSEFKHPRLLEFRKGLPRSPLGKILRKHLMEEPADGILQSPAEATHPHSSSPRTAKL